MVWVCVSSGLRIAALLPKALKHGVGELLGRPTRRHVLSRQASYQLEIRSKELRELAGVVALDGKPAAPIGSAGSESRNDNMSTWAHRPPNGFQVGLSISFLGKEMKHGPVVPHVNLLREPHVPPIYH